jgi:spermidine/putrescine transport system permease protein
VGWKQGSDGLTAYATVYLLFLYGPILLLPLFSVNDSYYIVFPLRGFTLGWYRQMADNTELLDALRASLGVAVSVAIGSTVLGVLAAKALTRYKLPGRGLITGFLMLPLVIPSLVLALALLVVLRRFFDIELSLYTVAAGHVMLCVPYSMLVVMARLEGFDRSLEEAAMDLCDNVWQIFWRITFPLAWPAIVSSLLLCFSASFDEYVLAAFLSGNQATLPVFIFSQLRFPQRLPGVLALGSCILLGSIIVVVFAEWIRRHGAPALRSNWEPAK